MNIKRLSKKILSVVLTLCLISIGQTKTLATFGITVFVQTLTPNGKVYMREKPNEHSRIIATVPNGTALEYGSNTSSQDTLDQGNEQNTRIFKFTDLGYQFQVPIETVVSNVIITEDEGIDGFGESNLIKKVRLYTKDNFTIAQRKNSFGAPPDVEDNVILYYSV